MTTELIVGAILVVVVLLVLKGKSQRQPLEKTFSCTRCKTISPHNPRTIEAWRNNKTTFFCQACHSKWLQSRPSHPRGQQPYKGGSGSRAGCLGVLILGAVIPLAGYALLSVFTG